MFARSLLGLAAVGLLAVVAVPPPAAGRSLTEAEQWRTRGGMLKQNYCCGVATDCDNTPEDEIPDCENADPCRGNWLIGAEAVATCVETDQDSTCDDGTENQTCATKKRCAFSTVTNKCKDWPNGEETRPNCAGGAGGVSPAAGGKPSVVQACAIANEL